MTYDANGNLIKDLDRSIVTIQYNVLNLPDVIQFYSGNQIRNLYDASGQKLGTEYFTWQPGTTVPIVNTGDVLTLSNSTATVQTGTAYIGNYEYKTLYGNNALTTLSRIYNDEGYVENLTRPEYYYYRKDHLGNNREVIASNNAIVQRTSYYPSGLPLPYQDSDSPSLQNRKYNGKEFVEMHGLDEYDSEARWYSPAIMRTTTIDPLAEKYYDISPYAWCGNNPVSAIDPDGRDTLDIVKNDAGKWSVSKTQIVKGDDVFRVKTGDETKTYIFSEGEYGKRVNVLNMENSDDYTLGIYHISGAEKGGTGYTITPGGKASTVKGSNKRLPQDTYILGQGAGKWQQPWVLSGMASGAVSSRGIKFHFGYSTPRAWTKGCFILSNDYSKVGNTIKYTESQSRQALRDFDRNLGAKNVYDYNLKGTPYTLIGAQFGRSVLYHKLILKDGF